MMDRVIKNPFVRGGVAVIAGLTVIFSFNIKSASGFSFLGGLLAQENINIANNVSTESRVDSTALGMTIAHSSVGRRSFGSNYQGGMYDQTIDRIEQLIRKDILGMIQRAVANQKMVVLTNHIKETDSLIMQAQQLLSQYVRENNLFAQESSLCSSDKAIADNNFFRAVQQNSSNEIMLSIEKAVSAEQCIGANRVRINANTILFNRLNQRLNLLMQQNILLSQNKDLIVNNIDLLQGDLVPRLAQLKVELDRLSIIKTK